MDLGPAHGQHRRDREAGVQGPGGVQPPADSPRNPYQGGGTLRPTHRLYLRRTEEKLFRPCVSAAGEEPQDRHHQPRVVHGTGDLLQDLHRGDAGDREHPQGGSQTAGHRPPPGAAPALPGAVSFRGGLRALPDGTVARDPPPVCLCRTWPHRPAAGERGPGQVAGQQYPGHLSAHPAVCHQFSLPPAPARDRPGTAAARSLEQDAVARGRRSEEHGAHALRQPARFRQATGAYRNPAAPHGTTLPAGGYGSSGQVPAAHLRQPGGGPQGCPADRLGGYGLAAAAAQADTGIE